MRFGQSSTLGKLCKELCNLTASKIETVMNVREPAMCDSEVDPRHLETLLKLDRFLNEYTEELEKKAWCRRYHYIDAFAGSGTRVSQQFQASGIDCDSLIAIAEYGQNQKEHIEFTMRSPYTAVRINRPFGSYTFVEQSARRLHVLEAIAKDHKELRLRVVTEPCSAYLRRLTLRTEWKSQRALLFLKNRRRTGTAK